MMRESGIMDAMDKDIGQGVLEYGIGHYPMGNGLQNPKSGAKSTSSF